MQTVQVKLGPRSYDIAITSGDAAGFAPFVRSALPKASTALVVCDSNTQTHGRTVEAALREDGLRTGFAAVPAGESSKCMEQLAKLYDALYDLAADRTETKNLAADKPEKVRELAAIWEKQFKEYAELANKDATPEMKTKPKK